MQYRYTVLALIAWAFFGGFSSSFSWTAAAHGQTITLTPAEVEAGSPMLIRVDMNGTHRGGVQGEWMGHTLQFFEASRPSLSSASRRGSSGRNSSRGDFAAGVAATASDKHSSWYALAGVDVEAPVGPSTLHITVTDENGRGDEMERAVPIRATHYRTGALTVAPGFVEPDARAQQRIARERALKERTFSTSSPMPLWSGGFRAPVVAAPTDSFGTRRVFNGKLASIHKGMDFRARSGTPVRAANAGVVVLAQPLYFEGNCVVIDHGLGLFTLSMHLSRTDVEEGQHLKAGEQIGLSGATGRATGAHLHWAVRWQSAYLDPAKLMQLKLPETEQR